MRKDGPKRLVAAILLALLCAAAALTASACADGKEPGAQDGGEKAQTYASFPDEDFGSEMHM